MQRKRFILSVFVIVLIAQYAIMSCGAMLAFSLGEPRSPGYWKNHSEAWPTKTVTIGGVTYTQNQALDFLSGNAKDATYKLASNLVAAKLNAASCFFGSYDLRALWRVIGEADAFLSANPLGSNPKGATRDYCLSLKDFLDAFNNS